MNRSKKAIKLKELVRVKERIHALNRAMRNLPSRPLPKKIFAGHWRYFVVRSDIMRSSIGSQVERVVAACNHWVRGNKRDPKSFRGHTERLLSSTISGYQSEQYLHPLNQDEWDEAGFPEHFKRKWFDVQTAFLRVGTKNIPRYRYFPKVPSWMMEFAYKPAYITEATEPDGDLESELHRLNDFMERERGYQRLGGRNYDEYDWGIAKKKSLTRISRKEAQDAVFEAA